MQKDSKIYIAGHRGMVGSAIVRKLRSENFNNLIYKTSKELDLTNQKSVYDFFEDKKPEYVFLVAAKVGGILANNTYRAQFLFENLMIESNVIHAAKLNNVKKLLFLGSSCIYPKLAKQPMQEDSLLTGSLESTNEPYAIAKIAGIKLCETYRSQYDSDFISAMPTNLYGPNDNYDLNTSHVLPALIRKFHSSKINKASSVEIWGSGSPMREFLHVDDLAEACLFLIQTYSDKKTINIGSGSDISIKELAILIKELVGFDGKLKFDITKPDGTPKKLMSSKRINDLGWNAKISLTKGIKKVYNEVNKLDW